MPNGGSDCCGTCWFNRSNGGKRGSTNFNRTIPSFCEIRDLAIPNPFYTYCANHPHHRPNRDTIPIGPVYVGDADGVRELWQPSPDTEDIRQHLLDIVRSPKEHTDSYPFFSSPPHMKAIRQLVDFNDPRSRRCVGGPSPAGRGGRSSFGHTRSDQDCTSRAGSVGWLHEQNQRTGERINDEGNLWMDLAP